MGTDEAEAVPEEPKGRLMTLGNVGAKPLAAELTFPSDCMPAGVPRQKIPKNTHIKLPYIEMTSLKGVSSMKLHRDLGVTQRTAWFMLQRIRTAFAPLRAAAFEGPVEADETYVGGLEKNKHEHKKLRAGRGTVGKTAVLRIKDRKTGQVRTKAVEDTTAATVQQFVQDNTVDGVTLYTDTSTVYKGTDAALHEAVNHSVSEWAWGMAHTNGLESFWALFKRAFHGTYHHLSRKHLNRYVPQFAGKHNVRDMDTMAQMQHIVACMVGKRLMYKELVANEFKANG